MDTWATGVDTYATCMDLSHVVGQEGRRCGVQEEVWRHVVRYFGHVIGYFGHVVGRTPRSPGRR